VSLPDLLIINRLHSFMAYELLQFGMKKGLVFLSLFGAFSLQAGPTNSVLFVTQVPIPGDFTSIGSTFGNHRAGPG
jgi:hypothetical protein